MLSMPWFGFFVSLGCRCDFFFCCLFIVSYMNLSRLFTKQIVWKCGFFTYFNLFIRTTAMQDLFKGKQQEQAQAENVASQVFSYNFSFLPSLPSSPLQIKDWKKEEKAYTARSAFLPLVTHTFLAWGGMHYWECPVLSSKCATQINNYLLCSSLLLGKCLQQSACSFCISFLHSWHKFFSKCLRFTGVKIY